MKITQIFKEANGHYSNTRILVTIMILWSFVLATIITNAGIKKYSQIDSNETLMNIVLAATVLVSTVSTIAGTIKLTQKKMEDKLSGYETVEDIK